MTNLTRWDPFIDVRQAIDRIVDQEFTRPWRPQGWDHQATFPVEISETDRDLNVKAALPGVEPKDVQISIQNNMLSIRAEHKEESETRRAEFHRREVMYGSYNRTIPLPMGVDADKAEAEFENGMLRLHLPKLATSQAKQIQIKRATT